MELKRFRAQINSVRPVLLIVPYGIETGFVIHGKRTGYLLIVPYGIETTV